MAEIKVRRGERGDLARLAEIYNYYVSNTPITFDLKPVTIEERAVWLRASQRRRAPPALRRGRGRPRPRLGGNRTVSRPRSLRHEC